MPRDQKDRGAARTAQTLSTLRGVLDALVAIRSRQLPNQQHAHMHMHTCICKHEHRHGMPAWYATRSLHSAKRVAITCETCTTVSNHTGSCRMQRPDTVYCGSTCSGCAGRLLAADPVTPAPAQKYIPNGGGKKVEATLKGEGGRRGVGSHVGGMGQYTLAIYPACMPTRLPCKHGYVTAGQTC